MCFDGYNGFDGLLPAPHVAGAFTHRRNQQIDERNAFRAKLQDTIETDGFPTKPAEGWGHYSGPPLPSFFATHRALRPPPVENPGEKPAGSGKVIS